MKVPITVYVKYEIDGNMAPVAIEYHGKNHRIRSAKKRTGSLTLSFDCIIQSSKYILYFDELLNSWYFNNNIPQEVANLTYKK